MDRESDVNGNNSINPFRVPPPFENVTPGAREVRVPLKFEIKVKKFDTSLMLDLRHLGCGHGGVWSGYRGMVWYSRV